MPLTNARQTADWQSRFNQVVRDVLGPPLEQRGYHISIDQVIEEVEPDSYGPFYVGEVGYSRPLPGGDYAHIVVQATTQAGTTDHVFYVDIVRNGRPLPPHYLDPASPGTLRRERIGDPAAAGAVRSRQGWSFSAVGELRAALDRLVRHLTSSAAESGVTTLDVLEDDAPAAAGRP